MKAVVQRVLRGSVRVDGRVVGRCERGMVVLLGVMDGDGSGEARRLAERIASFRFFSDATGRMNRDVIEAGGSALVVSQVTLAADGRKGRRPSLEAAAPPAVARVLYEEFTGHLRTAGIPTEMGIFGAKMEVEIVGDGPVTFVLEAPGRGA